MVAHYLRARVIEFETTDRYTYTVVDIMEDGKIFRTVVTLEREQRGGYSKFEVHCDCREFKQRGVCRHIIEALSIVRNQPAHNQSS